MNFAHIIRFFIMILVLHRCLFSAEQKILFNAGMGLIGDGDLTIKSIGTGTEFAFFNILIFDAEVSTCFGNHIENVNEKYSLNLDYPLNRYSNYYAIQGDLSIGIFKNISFFTPSVFCGITPTYESQIGSRMYISAGGGGLGDIDIWYGMDRGFSTALHYGVSLRFSIKGVTTGLKGIYRFDDDNTWALVLWEIGIKYR